MAFEIIDFHTHPFLNAKNNICQHTDVVAMSADSTVSLFKKLGVSKICGSVIDCTSCDDIWQKVKANNDAALKLKQLYGDFYVPGFHIHADFVEQSLDEMRRMKQMGVKLIGELVPYIDKWQNGYASENMSVLLDFAGKNNMIVSFHSMHNDEMDEMVKRHKDVVFVAAHPGEYPDFMRHIERMKYSENYYLDLSGYGIFRHGMLKKAVETFGEDRILFGSDYPTCDPGMYLGGVLFDHLITDRQKEKIFSLNAKRILGI